MHACCEIYFSKRPDNIEAAVEEVLLPHQEGLGSGGWFDWYQIGGRYTGNHTSYDPREDPKNIETCSMCNGTGIRPGGKEEFGEAWFKSTKGCNGCQGTGNHVVWPTAFAPYKHDILEIEKCKDELMCYTLIIADTGEVFHREEWNGEGFVKTDFQESVKEKLKKLGYESGVLVTVDYHS